VGRQPPRGFDDVDRISPATSEFAGMICVMTGTEHEMRSNLFLWPDVEVDLECAAGIQTGTEGPAETDTL
jgi:hypothetical protein